MKKKNAQIHTHTHTAYIITGFSRTWAIIMPLYKYEKRKRVKFNSAFERLFQHVPYFSSRLFPCLPRRRQLLLIFLHRGITWWFSLSKPSWNRTLLFSNRVILVILDKICSICIKKYKAVILTKISPRLHSIKISFLSYTYIFKLLDSFTETYLVYILLMILKCIVESVVFWIKWASS